MAESGSSTHVGWCPGALRPMMAGDGLLVRVKPRGNRLTISQARGIAAMALRHGNGVLAITGRANLQVRGIDERSLPCVLDTLGGLGLLDASAEAEAARNVVSSPLAGSGFPAAFDIRPAVAALEEALAENATFHRLPAKFAWTVDDGGPFPLDGAAGDICFTAADAALFPTGEKVPDRADEGSFPARLAPHPPCRAPSPRERVEGHPEASRETPSGSAGAPTFVIALSGGDAWATCPADTVPENAARLADAFLTLSRQHGQRPHRMRDLVAACGARAIFEAAGLTALNVSPVPRASSVPIGMMRTGITTAIGIAPPFGRLEVQHLDHFAREAGRHGATSIGLTPWRSLLVTGIVAADRLLHVAETTGFIVDPADPRLSLAACSGAPACRRAKAPVQADAATLAPILGASSGGSIQVHLSGCAKGCAHAGAAPWTVVAAEGGYDLVRDGRAGDPPLATKLSLDEVAARLAATAPACMETV